MDVESAELWSEIDALILSRCILQSLVRIREASGVSLKDALDLLSERYRLLRAERPDEFCCSSEEYWEGFYP